jgi:hypothetical protein
MKGGRKNLEMKKMTLKPRTTLTYEWDTKRRKTITAHEDSGYRVDCFNATFDSRLADNAESGPASCYAS